MNYLVIEGFEMYSASLPFSAKYAVVGTVESIVAGRFGGQALRVNDSGFWGVTLGSRTQLSAGFALRLSSIQEVRTFLRFVDSGGNIMASGNVASSGAIEFVLGNTAGSNTMFVTAPGVMSANSWGYIEVEYVQSATTGTMNAYLNGVQIGTFTGNTGSNALVSLSLGATVTGASVNADFDDMYITDTPTRIGECRIDLLVPNTDDSVQWTPKSGSTNYTQVNEGPSDGDTSYVYSNTPGQVDQYALADLGSVPDNIYAVRTVVSGRKDDASTRTIRGGLVSGSTTANGSTVALSTSYGLIEDFYEQDPGTSAAWTTTGVNALKVKIEEIS